MSTEKYLELERYFYFGGFADETNSFRPRKDGGVYFKNKKEVVKKLRRFINSGKDKIHLLFDFDRTITVGKNRKGDDYTVWGALQELLSPEAKKEYFRFYKKYRKLEIENKLTNEDAATWASSILDLYASNGLKLSDVKKVSNKIKIRKYARGLFRICNKKGIPTIIISGGIKNVIELVCRRAKIRPTLVLSSVLDFSKNGHICGWERGSLVHMLNKKERGHKEIAGIKLARPNIMLIGDSLDDVIMADGKDNVLRVAVNNPRKDDKKDKMKELIKKFDLVIKDESFLPVIKILKLFK